MDKDFMQYVYVRTEKALTKSEEYSKIYDRYSKLSHEDKEYDNVSCELAAKEQELCYIQGFKDAIQIIMGVNNHVS